MTDKIRKIEGITKESTEALIAETLSVYPEKAKKKRAPHLGANDQGSGSACVKSNKKTVPRRDECPWLCLCRRQGRCLGANPRHGPRFPRPGRLRLVLMGYSS